MHSQPRIDNNLERRNRAPREKTNQSAIKTPSGNNDEVRNPGSTSRRGRESMHNLGILKRSEQSQMSRVRPFCLSLRHSSTVKPSVKLVSRTTKPSIDNREHRARLPGS